MRKFSMIKNFQINNLKSIQLNHSKLGVFGELNDKTLSQASFCSEDVKFFLLLPPLRSQAKRARSCHRNRHPITKIK